MAKALNGDPVETGPGTQIRGKARTDLGLLADEEAGSVIFFLRMTGMKWFALLSFLVFVIPRNATAEPPAMGFAYSPQELRDIHQQFLQSCEEGHEKTAPRKEIWLAFCVCKGDRKKICYGIGLGHGGAREAVSLAKNMGSSECQGCAKTPSVRYVQWPKLSSKCATHGYQPNDSAASFAAILSERSPNRCTIALAEVLRRPIPQSRFFRTEGTGQQAILLQRHEPEGDHS